MTNSTEFVGERSSVGDDGLAVLCCLAARDVSRIGHNYAGTRVRSMCVWSCCGRVCGVRRTRWQWQVTIILTPPPHIDPLNHHPHQLFTSNTTTSYTQHRELSRRHRLLPVLPSQAKPSWSGRAASSPPLQPQQQQTLPHRRQTPRAPSTMQTTSPATRTSVCVPTPRMWPVAWPFDASWGVVCQRACKRPRKRLHGCRSGIASMGMWWR